MRDSTSVMSDAKTVMRDGVRVMRDGHVDEEARNFGTGDYSYHIYLSL